MMSNVSNETTSDFQTSSSMSLLVWFEIIGASLTYGFGFLGNFLSLIIFYGETELRTVSTGILFLLITLFNTIHLWTLTTEFLGTFGILMYGNEFFQCRLTFFVQNTSRAMCTFLALSVTIDRLIRSEFPLRSRKICTTQNTMKLSFIYLIIFSLLFSFWFCPLNKYHPIVHVCYTGDSLIYNFFINQIYFPGRFLLVYVIPVIGMIGTNVRVLMNLQRSRRRVQNLSQMIGTLEHSGANSTRLNSLDRLLLTMMLVNVITFILTQTPFHIAMISRAYGSLDVDTYLLIRPLLLIWSSIYFGIGFYAYCLATPLFRKRSMKIFLRILRFRRIRPI